MSSQSFPPSSPAAMSSPQMPSFTERLRAPPTRVSNPTWLTQNLRFVEKQLRSAKCLMTTKMIPLLRLEEVNYPCDTEGRPIPLEFDAWVAYARNHVFLENIACFCVILTGEYCSVKLVRPRDRSKDTFHLGCFHWDRNGGGCQYFLDVKACFKDRLYMQETELYVRKPLDTNTILHTANTFAVAHMKATSPPVIGSPHGGGITDEVFEEILAQASDLDTVLSVLGEEDKDLIARRPPPPTKSSSYMTPSLLKKIEVRPWLQYMTPGWVADAGRLHSPSQDDLKHVYTLPTPSVAETVDVLARMFMETEPGIAYNELMRLLGACKMCGFVVALCVFDKHECVNESLHFQGLNPLGPTPSPRPSSAAYIPTPFSSSPLLASWASGSQARSSSPPSSTPSTPSSSPLKERVMLGKRKDVLTKAERRVKVKLELEDPDTVVYDIDKE